MVADLTPQALFPLVSIFTLTFFCPNLLILDYFKVYALRLDQRWMMFAPPPTSGSYHTIEMQKHPHDSVLLFSDYVKLFVLWFPWILIPFWGTSISQIFCRELNMREYFWKVEKEKKRKEVSLEWISSHIDMHVFYGMLIGTIGKISIFPFFLTISFKTC